MEHVPLCFHVVPVFFFFQYHEDFWKWVDGLCWVIIRPWIAFWCLCKPSGLVHLRRVQPPMPTTRSLVERLSMNLLLNIFKSGLVLPGNCVCLQKFFPLLKYTSVSQFTLGPWNLWETCFAPKFVRSFTLQSVP